MRDSVVGSSGRRRAFVLIVAPLAVVAVAAGLAGTTLASGKADTKVYACVRNATGAVRIVRASTRCRHSERKISWAAGATLGARGAPGVIGARGPTGLTGLRGPTGLAGARGLAGTDGVQVQRASRG